MDEPIDPRTWYWLPWEQAPPSACPFRLRVHQEPTGAWVLETSIDGAFWLTVLTTPPTSEE